MSWAPTDLVSDADLLDYEPDILRSFGETSFHGKRTKALEDWLFPILKSQGFDPQKLRTRYECDQVWSYTGSVYNDQTGASSSATDDDLSLADVFANPSADALYVGSTEPFRGLFVRVLDTPGTATAALSVAYWNGNWEPLLIADGTSQVAGKTFSAGGSVTWLLPMDWATRKVNSSAALYWAKVTVNAVPTNAMGGQIGVIRGTSLRAPATFRTLELIFREAPTGGDGPWAEKASYYAGQADQALQRALLICGGEFETDDSDLIDSTEAAQTPEQAGGGWKLERA